MPPDEDIEMIKEEYAKIRVNLRTGDVVFFKAGGVSDAIAAVEENTVGSGKYTHMGIVILSNSFPIGSEYRLCDISGNDYATIPYIFESTMSKLVGGDGTLNVGGKGMLGVQLRTLDGVIHTYGEKKDTQISIGKLKDDLHIDDTKLYESFFKYNKKNYQLNLWYLFTSAFRSIRFLRKLPFFLDMGIFCSQLVALVLQENDILSKDINPADCIPMDFFPKSKTKTYDTDINQIPILFSQIIELNLKKVADEKARCRCW
jgi:hypothetical protein